MFITMKYLVILLVCVIGALAYPESRIHNGKKAIANQFPYQAAIHVDVNEEEEGRCGGSLISKKCILTAAHCLEDSLNTGFVLLGTTDYEKGGQKIPFNKVIVHENYDSKLVLNDIALIVLSKDAVLSDAVKIISIDYNPVKENTPITIAGWGSLSETEDGDDLMYTTLTSVSDKTCQSWGDDIKTQICLIDANSATCQGDSGGSGVIQKGKESYVVSLVSYGLGKCTVNSKDVHTRVAAFKPWIEKHLANNP